MHGDQVNVGENRNSGNVREFYISGNVGEFVFSWLQKKCQNRRDKSIEISNENPRKKVKINVKYGYTRNQDKRGKM